MSISLAITETTNGFTLSSQTYSLSLSSGISPVAQQGSGSPVDNSVVPAYFGQLYKDTSTYGTFWIAAGVASSDWVEMTRNF